MIKDFGGKQPRIAQSAFVSEAAYVVGDVVIGDHANIWPGAVIRGDFGKISIGDNTCIEDNCVIHGGGDLSIGSNVIIGHGAVIHCRSIGNRVLVGNNATLLDNAEIGDCCIIGAGCLIPPQTQIAPNSIAMGVPATVKSSIEKEQLEKLEEGVLVYKRLAARYKRQGL